MIGWYHTGPKLRASDQEINDLLKQYIARPVMVIVDVRPETVGIPTDAYFAVEEIKDVRYLFRRRTSCLNSLHTRTVQKHARHSYTVLPLSRRKRRRKLV